MTEKQANELKNLIAENATLQEIKTKISEFGLHLPDNIINENSDIKYMKLIFWIDENTL